MFRGPRYDAFEEPDVEICIAAGDQHVDIDEKGDTICTVAGMVTVSRDY